LGKTEWIEKDAKRWGEPTEVPLGFGKQERTKNQKKERRGVGAQWKKLFERPFWVGGKVKKKAADGKGTKESRKGYSNKKKRGCVAEIKPFGVKHGGQKAMNEGCGGEDLVWSGGELRAHVAKGNQKKGKQADLGGGPRLGGGERSHKNWKGGRKIPRRQRGEREQWEEKKLSKLGPNPPEGKGEWKKRNRRM